MSLSVRPPCNAETGELCEALTQIAHHAYWLGPGKGLNVLYGIDKNDQTLPKSVVYRVNSKSSYVVEHCPFCGQKLGLLNTPAGWEEIPAKRQEQEALAL